MRIKAFIGGVIGHALTDEERKFLREEKPYGVILFARNVRDPQQLSALCADIKQQLDHPYASILIDQEGGRVARMKPPHWRAYPPALELAAKNNPERAVYVSARLMAEELRACGITSCTAGCLRKLSSSSLRSAGRSVPGSTTILP